MISLIFRLAIAIPMILGFALPAWAQTKNPDVAQSLFRQGRSDDAMSRLESQVGTNPFDAVAMNNLAAVKAANQDWVAVSELLVRAHQIDPENKVIKGNLSQINSFLANKMQLPQQEKGRLLTDESEIWPEPPALWQAPAPAAAATRSTRRN
jgi:hypothetical protein